MIGRAALPSASCSTVPSAQANLVPTCEKPRTLIDPLRGLLQALRGNADLRRSGPYLTYPRTGPAKLLAHLFEGTIATIFQPEHTTSANTTCWRLRHNDQLVQVAWAQANTISY